MKSAKKALQDLQVSAQDLANISGELKAVSVRKLTKRDKENITDAVIANLRALKDLVGIGKHIKITQLNKLLDPKTEFVKPKPMGLD